VHRVVEQLAVPHDVRRAMFSTFLDRVPPSCGFGTDLCGTDRSGTDRSGTDRSGTDRSGTDRSSTDRSGGVGPRDAIALTFDDGSADHVRVAGDLAGRGVSGLFFLVTGLLGQPGFLTWQQARELVALGHEVGSHGADHLAVRPMTRTQVRAQVRDSKARLEDELQVPVRFFAPPFGRGSAALAEVLAEAGYRGCRLTRWGVHRPGIGDPWWLPSVPVTEFTLRSRWPDRILAEGRIPPVVTAIRIGRAVLPEPLRRVARRLLPTAASAREARD
jgi:peptidoglycan/xylan/chitin deacetylase (PgdA/CDA1 family)